MCVRRNAPRTGWFAGHFAGVTGGVPWERVYTRLASGRAFGNFAAMSQAPQAFQRWSTDAVPPAQRLDYWVGAVCEGFLEMDITSPVAGGSFGASLESAPLGPLVVNEVRGSAQDVYRTRRAIAHSRHNYYYLLCKTDSPWTMAQEGRCARLLPGDPVLVDSRRLMNSTCCSRPTPCRWNCRPRGSTRGCPMPATGWRAASTASRAGAPC
jgi:AraC family transcriptional activator of tynA and feaB